MPTWPPELPTDRIRPERPGAVLARTLLAESGGVASARHIRDQIAALHDEHLTMRQIRRLLRAPRVVGLGAGYYAIEGSLHEPVLAFAEQHLSEHGPLPIAALVAAIQDHYPRGDAGAIRQWIQQDPGRIQQDRGIVRFTPQRWRQP